MKKNFKVLICERKQSNSAQYIIQTAHFCSTYQENEKLLDVRDIFLLWGENLTTEYLEPFSF
jgi:hypothetical protein